MAWRRRIERRGRPRRADAKRRATHGSRAPGPRRSRIARAGLPQGPCQQRQRRPRRAGRRHRGPERARAARHRIDADRPTAGVPWLRQVQRAFHLSQASPNALWAAITSGARAGQWTPLSNISGGDRALFRLAELHRPLRRAGPARSVGARHGSRRGLVLAGDTPRPPRAATPGPGSAPPGRGDCAINEKRPVHGSDRERAASRID
jgi:hypothetical protein